MSAITPELLPKRSFVVCENGHIVCRVARDLRRGERIEAQFDLTHFVQREPTIGAPCPPCDQCGARWYNGYPVRLHIKDYGWWPPVDVAEPEPRPSVWRRLRSLVGA